MTDPKRLSVLLALVLALAGCAAASTGLSDAQRAWCGAHPMAVITAGASLSLPAPSRFVEHKAELEQATIDGNQALEEQITLEWVAQAITATDSDPHPGVASMPSWAADAPADFERACRSVAAV